MIVLPVTHSPPQDPALAMELPAPTKRRLGLDEARSWIILSDGNRLSWPGPDLRPLVAGEASTILYGELPASFLRALREKWLTLSAARWSIVTRTE